MKLFGLIDRYIISKFLGTFFYAIALIISITIVFDISEKIDDFIQKEAPLDEIVFTYYVNFVPYFVNLFSPLFTFIAVIFFTSRMAYNTEIVAVLSSGISFRRLLLPYMISAVILTILSLALSNFIIPPSNQKRLDFENTYIRNPLHYNKYNIHRQVSPNTFVYFESYNTNRNFGYRFTLERFAEQELVYKISADFLRWDSIKEIWTMENYIARTFQGVDESLIHGTKKDTILNMHPDDFGKRIDNVETMNYFQLNQFIKDEKFKGSDNIAYYEIEKHRRISMPFATIILTLIGVSIASRKVRGGIGLHIGIGLFISFSYIMFMQVATTLVTNAGMDASIAMWIPNLIYFFLSFYMIRIAPK